MSDASARFEGVSYAPQPRDECRKSAHYPLAHDPTAAGLSAHIR